MHSERGKVSLYEFRRRAEGSLDFDFRQYQGDLFNSDAKLTSDIFASITDRYESSIIVLDRNASIISRNRAAQIMLEKGDGLISNGPSFTAVRAAERSLLSKAIGRAVVANGPSFQGTVDPSTLLISRSERLPLTVSIVPAKLLLDALDVSLNDSDKLPAAVVIVADPETPLADSIRRVCKVYGLTPAETRLAELLVDGLTLSEIADAMELKLSTVRVYLKQVFSKTGVHRQPMLIRMLLTARIPLPLAN
jgi:DNA-binding CsgD family transcriptional regulator